MNRACALPGRRKTAVSGFFAPFYGRPPPKRCQRRLLCAEYDVSVVPGREHGYGGMCQDLRDARHCCFRFEDEPCATLTRPTFHGSRSGLHLGRFTALPKTQGLLPPCGSCQIGGNPPPMRAAFRCVTVCERPRPRTRVVLPDGRIGTATSTARQHGYDLKQLFLGSEGTLGIITAAALKLFPAPRATCTFIAAVRTSPAQRHSSHGCEIQARRRDKFEYFIETAST